MSSFWWNSHHWLHWKLSKWQLPVQSVMKISSKWRHFCFSVSNIYLNESWNTISSQHNKICIWSQWHQFQYSISRKICNRLLLNCSNWAESVVSDTWDIFTHPLKRKCHFDDFWLYNADSDENLIKMKRRHFRFNVLINICWNLRNCIW